MLGGLTGMVQAFDGAMQVEHSYLNPENFLDLQSYQFGPQKDRAWRRAEEGWRTTGGSLGLDLLYTRLQVKLWERLPHGFAAGLSVDHEEFYEIKPLRYQVEVEWRPIALWGVSLIGMPSYDKRNADQGVALTFGQRTGSYLRVSHLPQNLFYNEKNLYDNSSLNPHPVENQVEGAWFGESWEAAFRQRWDLPSQLEDPDRSVTFHHQGLERWALLEYTDRQQRVWGWKQRFLQSRKAREAPPSGTSQDRRRQTLEWHSQTLEVECPGESLAAPSSGQSYGLGIRWDVFRNHLVVTADPKSSEDFQLTTLQIFGSWRDPGPEHAWEYGLYLGAVEKRIVYEDPGTPADHEPSTQAKLRVSWDLLHADGQGSWMITTTWNLDGLPRDFWDGGNMTYQRTF